MTYIEDILHLIVDTIRPNETDKEILTSISRQCKKGMPLTDRQFELIKTKIDSYKEQLKEYKIDLTDIAPRLPLREVNREKSITISLTPNSYPQKTYEQNTKWIKVRFPFSKKNIVSIDSLSAKHTRYYHHIRGSHEHYFKLTEFIIKEIVDAFINKSFTIEQEVLDYYNEIVPIANNPLEYIPALVDNKCKNLNNSAIELINSEIGTIDDSNVLKLYDRRFRYGINHIPIDIPDNLSGNIANRNTQEILIDSSVFNLNQIVESIVYLDRFPILALIDTNEELEQVSKIYNAFDGVVPANKQTVLFRVDQSNNYVVNDFIREKGLNNWLDSNTKIVYVSKNKLPKLLLKTSWRPMCVLSLSSNRSYSHIATYVKDVCDLIVSYDTQSSIMKRSKHGIM
jgi:hypothetical protein